MQTDIHGPSPLDVAPVLALSLPLLKEGSPNLLAGDTDVAQKNQYSFAFFKRQKVSLDKRDSGPSGLLAQLSCGASEPVEPDRRYPVTTSSEPSTVYENVGSPNDLPRSIAICPQRKCVAFGCRSGIELHWTDALTGTDLSRWFPLAAPSDFLYFLPQKRRVDPTKKLRLVSSAAWPSQQRGVRPGDALTRWRYSTLTRRHGQQDGVTTLPLGDRPSAATPSVDSSFPSVIDSEDVEKLLRTVECDHYRAVPLSDGTHMLFTDPTTGLLCLGSDAPLGGPTKLIRKACMIHSSAPDSMAGSLVCYAAGQDLRWGVRVVAAYDNGRIDLFNMPSDCFERIRYTNSSPDMWDELAEVMDQNDLLMDVFKLDEIETSEGNQVITDRPIFASPTSFRSVQIDGAFIFQAEDIVDNLYVDSRDGGLRVWVFYSNGEAITLDVYAPEGHPIRSHVIRNDGLVRSGSSAPAYSQPGADAKQC